MAILSPELEFGRNLKVFSVRPRAHKQASEIIELIDARVGAPTVRLLFRNQPLDANLYTLGTNRHREYLAN
jgi:hypothetical protein